MKTLKIFIFSFIFISTASHANECVILIHGLGRTSNSLKSMAKEINHLGYQVVYKNYPSTSYAIEELATKYIPKWLKICSGADKVHFVTHSLGGILVRYYLANFQQPKNLGNTVMMAPPNHGSELADATGSLLGPAHLQLRTSPESIPNQLNQLGTVNYSVGIIAGNKSANPLAHIFFDKPHDGKVTVESSKLNGMKDHIIMPVTHTFMMEQPSVIKQVVSFIYKASFVKK